MSRYLLDTTVLIDIARGHAHVHDHVRALAVAGETIATSAVTVAEYYSGADIGAEPDMDDLLTTLRCWPVTGPIARTAAAYRRAFRRRGVALGLPDVLIAAVARHHGATLLTANVKDFPMDDIRVERLGTEIG